MVFWGTVRTVEFRVTFYLNKAQKFRQKRREHRGPQGTNKLMRSSWLQLEMGDYMRRVVEAEGKSTGMYKEVHEDTFYPMATP